MPRYGHGSNFVALTATLEVKLSSRTLVDIMEAKNVRICSSYFVPHFFFLDGFVWQLGFEQKSIEKKKLRCEVA